ncbi:CBS domain-containing protein [Reichenbachiella versicolor]|uniref:CBS domain-containing protein n=1 Tax=Reichenbachiella versicolor TaxID=1821036 RepID=UPI000D6EAC23|nr:CBS domain-containing protein [Reichenbachiella versicolor]
MVKSFQGVKVETQEVSEIMPVSVSDYMSTKLTTFHPNQSIFDVVDTLLKRKISGAPVINDRKELVGIISEGDCLKEVVKGKYNNYPRLHGLVKDHMATNIKYISPEVNIFEAAHMFLNLRIRRFPVLDHNMKLVGMISQKDIMRAVLSLNTERW